MPIGEPSRRMTLVPLRPRMRSWGVTLMLAGLLLSSCTAVPTAPSSDATTSTISIPIPDVELPPADQWPLQVTDRCPVDSTAGCLVGFVVGDVPYHLGVEVVEGSVSGEVIGRGVLPSLAHGQEVTVNRLEGVDPTLAVAILLPVWGGTNEELVELGTTWMVGIQDYARMRDPAEVRRVECDLLLLDDEVRQRLNC